jgi:hypothetical protein
LAFKRSNPLPMSGALFVSNPGKKPARRKASSARKAKKSSVAARIIARLNGSKTTMKLNRRKKRNGLAIRANGLAVRMNGLAIRTNKRRKARKARRRNPTETALRFNGRRNRKHNRRRSRTRRNGLAVRMNGMVRRNRKHNRKRNTGAKGGNFLAAIVKPIQGIVSKLPGGKMIAGALMPLALGAAVGAVHLYALRYIGGYVPAMARPLGYTLGGLAVKTVLAVVPVGSASMRKSLGDAALIAGGAIDMMRYLSGKSDFSDGGMYEIGAYGEGGYTLPFDGDEQTIQHAYSDALPADAAVAAADMDAVEQDAALKGPRSWMARFPFARRVQSVHGAYSRHAGQHGHQWGWLYRLVGVENVRKIAAMPPEKRRNYLSALRAQAIMLLGQHTSVAIPVNTVPSQTLAGDYGAALYAGGPFAH